MAATGGKDLFYRHVAQHYFDVHTAAQTADAGHVQVGDGLRTAVDGQVATDLLQIHVAGCAHIELAAASQRHAQRIGSVIAPYHAVAHQREVAKGANGGKTVETRIGEAAHAAHLDQHVACGAHAVE